MKETEEVSFREILKKMTAKDWLEGLGILFVLLVVIYGISFLGLIFK